MNWVSHAKIQEPLPLDSQHLKEFICIDKSQFNYRLDKLLPNKAKHPVPRMYKSG